MLPGDVYALHGVGGDRLDLEPLLGEGGPQRLAEQLGVVDYDYR
jgi:hypothetical protein